jgi:tetratricopeptide (TPR) repeat protein
MAHYYLGLALLQLNDIPGAEEHLKQAEQLAEPSGLKMDDVKVALGRVYLKKGEFDQALTNLDTAAEMNPDNPGVSRYRGEVRVHKGDYAAAVQDLERAIQNTPQDAYAHYYAGLAFGKIGRPDRMADEFQMFLKLAPDAPEAAKVRSLLRGI